jgi:hypothetical protein
MTPQWLPSIDEVKHYASAGGGWPCLDSLEFEVAFTLTKLTFVFDEQRSPERGTYEQEPSQVCGLFGQGNNIR